MSEQVETVANPLEIDWAGLDRLGKLCVAFDCNAFALSQEELRDQGLAWLGRECLSIHAYPVSDGWAAINVVWRPGCFRTVNLGYGPTKTDAMLALIALAVDL